MTTKPRYTVRAMTSGRNGITKFNVWDTKRKGRVNVVAHHSREGAQMEADDLNVSDMVKDHVEDPRPYAVRLAEAKVAYEAGNG